MNGNNNNNNVDTEFAQYFKNLLGIPWLDYLMMDDELEMENPVCAPDAKS